MREWGRCEVKWRVINKWGAAAPLFASVSRLMLHVQRSPQGCRTVDSQEAIKTQRAVSLAGQSGATELQRYRWTPLPRPTPPPRCPPTVNEPGSQHRDAWQLLCEWSQLDPEWSEWTEGQRTEQLLQCHHKPSISWTPHHSQGQPGSQGQNYVKYYIYTGLLQVYNYTTVNRCCLKFRV